jgi:ATP-dependent DNA helicase RecQ
VSVYEKQLARFCRLTIEEVQQQLRQLQSFGIIEYLPQKDTPQIHFLLNRASAQYLQIDQDHYLQRKKLYEARVQNMMQYVTLPDACRSRYISNYFGDTAVKECGNCDNCLAKKRKTLSTIEFSLIEKQVLLSGSVNEVFGQLKKYHKEKIWTVLDHLQSEQVISIDEQGFIQKK